MNLDNITNAYCRHCLPLAENDVHRIYHDTEYGFPIANDNALFGRLILEINQAGLSWTTILKKKDNFFKAYSQFDIQTIANYTEEDRTRLLSDAGIIRNKLKVNAAIFNAQRIIEIQKEFGSFKAWLDHHHPMTREEWTKFFRKNFKFVGGEIVNEFLMSTGYLPGAHDENCPIFNTIALQNPAWSQ